MKKSKVLMFVDFIIFVIAIYMIYQIIDIVTYVVSMSNYEPLPVGEIVSYFSSSITYLFYIGILTICCGIYRRKFNSKCNNVKTINKSDINSPIAKAADTGNFTYTKNNEVTVEKPIKTESDATKAESISKSVNENKITVEETKFDIKPTVKSEPSRFSWSDANSKSSGNSTKNNMSKEEEKEIVRTLSKAVENYNKNRDDDDLEKQLSAAIEKHNAKPKTPSMKMTKDELIKYAVKNDIVVDENGTKAEILETINKKMRSKKKTKSTSKRK